MCPNFSIRCETLIMSISHATTCIASIFIFALFSLHSLPLARHLFDCWFFFFFILDFRMFLFYLFAMHKNSLWWIVYVGQNEALFVPDAELFTHCVFQTKFTQKFCDRIGSNFGIFACLRFVCEINTFFLWFYFFFLKENNNNKQRKNVRTCSVYDCICVCATLSLSLTRLFASLRFA